MCFNTVKVNILNPFLCEWGSAEHRVSFWIVDARDKPRKQRSDSYKDPLADNKHGKIYAKNRGKSAWILFKVPTIGV